MLDKKLLIYRLANKYNLPLETIEKIVSSQFQFVRKIMKEGNFEAVRLPYFGKFSAKPGRIKHITKLKHESKR